MRTASRITWWGFVSGLPVGILLGLVLALLQSAGEGVEVPLWSVGGAFVVAVTVHEAGHGVVLGLCGVPVRRLRARWGGLEIELGDAPPWPRAVAAVAGPGAAAVAGAVALVLAPSQIWAVALFVLGSAHGLTLLMPSGDARAAAAAVRELRAGPDRARETSVTAAAVRPRRSTS